MTLVKPSIQWTDGVGAAELVCVGLTFRNWTPDVVDVVDSQVTIGDGKTYAFAYRQDQIASFEISQIANTEAKLALRLKSHLTLGGVITINTRDSENRVYTSHVAPGTIPSFEMSDATELEYTLKAVVKNTIAEVLLYTPEAHVRIGSITFTPKPVVLDGDTDLVATVRDTAGTPVAGVTVSASSEDVGTFTVSPASAITDVDGKVTFTVSPVSDGARLLTARADNITAQTIVISGNYITSPLPIFWPKRDPLLTLDDGDTVSALADSSTSGWDLVTEANPPKWDADVLGGSILFDAAHTQALKNTSFDALATSAAFTVFVVGRLTSGGIFSLGTISPGYLLYGYLASGFFQFTAGDLSWRAKYTWAPDSLDHVFELVYNGAGSGNSGKVQQYLDGAPQTPTFDGTVPSSLSLAGDGIVLGRIIGGSYLVGNLAEPLIYPGALNPTLRATIRAALAAKYSLTVV